MSTHSIIPKDQLDQENQHQNVFTNDRAKNSSANTGKRPLALSSNSNEKRLRVPLSGKNQNLIAPLQRSKSFIPQNIPVSRPQLSGTTQNAAPVLAQKPGLSKSNSTLGFFHQPGKVSTKPARRITRDTNPHKNDVFPPLEAHRAKDLVPLFLTDSIKKHETETLPPLKTNLSDTFTERTASLHASNLPSIAAKGQFRDPVKKSTQSVEDIIEDLAENEDSVEIVPRRDLPALEENITGYTPLSDMELDILRGTRRNRVEQSVDMSFDSSFEESPEDLKQNRIYQAELERSGPVGLSQKDLEELLEF
ncbi:hypothetical protein PUMCH_003251 [Australozyma saopauloensis]|uniref:Securin n=1 Tax=Australozyma saopauloensis TaxID=291208 RepID=A0AAX4HBL3_9ASCO|nr:hypothetical protein PUMCH_003251 [[Candida] saopauloensis]